MEFDELKKVWKNQAKQESGEYTKSEVMMLINNRMVSLEEEVKSRDRLEIIAAVLIIICFGVILFTTNSVWKQFGSTIIIVSAVFIWYKLKSTQVESFSEQLSPDRPMKEYLHVELQRVQKQKTLLKNVAWWYILPIFTGLLFFSFGFDSSLAFQVGYMIFVALLSVGIWMLNQRTVKKKFDPLINEIQEAIRFIEKKDNSQN